MFDNKIYGSSYNYATTTTLWFCKINMRLNQGVIMNNKPDFKSIPVAGCMSSSSTSNAGGGF